MIMDKQDKQFIALETAINDEFIMLRKFDQYFPIYLVAKDNHSEVYALNVDYSKEELDLENTLPFQVIKPETLFTEIKLRIDKQVKERKTKSK